MGNIVVTGTSTGIGLATAITLARGGHTVFAGMRNLERGGELRDVAAKEKLPISIVRLDVDDDASVAEAFKRILGEKGQIDGLVNNAGIPSRGYIEETPVATFKKVMETNFYGGIRCIQAVVPSMRDKRSGCIVNVTSVAGRLGMSPQGAYAASKWALEGLSEVLAYELSPFNVRVAIVEPGVIATPMTMTPRPAPPPSPYAPLGRRLGAYFMASLSQPSSPFDVAKVIHDIIDGRSTKLRNPAGADGAALINWRQSVTDEEWVASSASSDADWIAEVKRKTGLDVKLG